MKYSYLWLKELSGTKKSPKELAELLTMRAFELEDRKTEGKETQLEFAILPNRGHDALSHVGLAREICACEGRKFHFLTSDVRKLLTSDVRSLQIGIKDKKLCSRYIGALIEGVKVGPSPKWMQEKLLVCGVKPINNIVDITNYVMLEFGQPLHAFDISQLATSTSPPPPPFNKGGMKRVVKIIIRKAKKREKIKLLDEKIYELAENDLVIADSEKAIALAGVMGGFESGITGKTESIILESANFNPTSIRKTRMRHNINTESSYRFERQIDPNLAEIGAARTIELIQKLCGKNVKITALSDIYPKKTKPWKIKLNTDYVNKLLGEKIPVAKMKNILENLGLKILGSSTSKFFQVEIPTRRIDLKTQEDLIEEIGRIFGYENIKEQAPVAEVKTPPENKKRNFENRLRDILAGLGFSEVMNYSFVSADDIAKCNLKIEDHIEVANPLSSDQQYLRWSLAPNLLKNIALNLKNFSDVKIFEIGNKFALEKSKTKEATVVVGAIAIRPAKEDLFFELKGKVEALLEKIGYKNSQFSILLPDSLRDSKRAGNSQFSFWHQSRSAEIKIHGKEIGRIGEVSPLVLRKYGIKTRVALFGLRISELIERVGYPEEKLYCPISKFPVVERDISMFISGDTKFNEIVTKINEAGGNLLKDIGLFDVFEKAGEKSLALRLKIGSNAKTLTSEEIDTVMKKIISKLEKDLKVRVRK